MNKKYIIIIILLIIIISGVVILNILNKNNENKGNSISKGEYYVKENAIYEKFENINENAINTNINKINEISDKYLKDMNIYFTLIPNKEYYLDEQNKQQFNQIENIVRSKVNNNIKYFTIKETLKLEDYYRTDMHWKQENLGKTVNKIEKELGIYKKENIKYEEKSLGEFYGQYYKDVHKLENSKLTDVQSDELIYLNNKELENCKVYNTETQKDEKIYNKDRANETNNKYDLFLSGATALTTITNEKADTEKKLILFRDSFGSSIAPLFVNDYKEIILIDIRYINSTILENYIDFDKYEDVDVLFLYSSRVINKSGIFR